MRISQNIVVLLTKHTPFLKPTMFSIESSVMIVDFSTENYPPTSKDRRFLSFNGDSKSPASIRADECFRHLHVIPGVISGICM
jgi:hypothetical protein